MFKTMSNSNPSWHSCMIANVGATRVLGDLTVAEFSQMQGNQAVVKGRGKNKSKIWWSGHTNELERLTVQDRTDRLQLVSIYESGMQILQLRADALVPNVQCIEFRVTYLFTYV